MYFYLSGGQDKAVGHISKDILSDVCDIIYASIFLFTDLEIICISI